MKENEEKKQKLEEQARKFNESQLVSCSFHPKINHMEGNSLERSRNIEDFYQNQIQWGEKIKQKRELERERKEKNEYVIGVPKPAISEKTRSLAEKKYKDGGKSNDVHLRLYEFKKNRQIIKGEVEPFLRFESINFIIFSNNFEPSLKRK